LASETLLNEFKTTQLQMFNNELIYSLGEK